MPDRRRSQATRLGTPMASVMTMIAAAAGRSAIAPSTKSRTDCPVSQPKHAQKGQMHAQCPDERFDAPAAGDEGGQRSKCGVACWWAQVRKRQHHRQCRNVTQAEERRGVVDIAVAPDVSGKKERNREDSEKQSRELPPRHAMKANEPARVISKIEDLHCTCAVPNVVGPICSASSVTSIGPGPYCENVSTISVPPWRRCRAGPILVR